MATADAQDLQWSAQFHIAPRSAQLALPGDKITLPPSALEQLLAAAPRVRSDQPAAATATFDPYNPYSFAAERHARAQSQYEQQQLPYPLTFRLVNSSNNRVAYAGIREFSAEEGSAGLSDFLANALGLEIPAPRDPPIEDRNVEVDAAANSGHATPDSNDASRPPSTGLSTDGPRITIHAKQLPKGTFVKLRPLEAGYDPDDWKSLLEDYLRKNFTTLSRGEILTIPARFGGQPEPFQFLIDQFNPDGDGICVVDTDLEVDIEALNEEQARETLKRIAAKSGKLPGTQDGSSRGGQLNFLQPQSGQVLEGEYVDYELSSWDRSQTLEIELTPASPDEQLCLFVSPFGPRQRAKPRFDEYVLGDIEGRGPKRIRLSPTNVELETAETVWVSVHAQPNDSNVAAPQQFTIRAGPLAMKPQTTADEAMEDAPASSDEVRCKNCQQLIPKGTLVLHENFCFRNNILCPKGCRIVFQKRSEEYANHWHCDHDSSYGNSSTSHKNHDLVFHTESACPNCSFTATSLPQLAQHRTTVCPGKLILCRFCHLVVPQEGDPSDASQNAEAMLTGLTPHEIADGARTTECHLCSRIVRLRDLSAHLQNHELERKSRPAPRLCRNVNCGRTLDGAAKNGDTRAGTRMGQGAGNEIGLCSTCFGPLYVNLYDPEGKALKRRVERKYLSQLVTGCGKSWCQNEYCKTGRKNLGSDGAEAKQLAAKDALPMAKPFVDGLMAGETPLHICVDETSYKRKNLAEMLEAEGRQVSGRKQYAREWCAGAVEAESGNLERARDWLMNFAPAKGEEY